MTEDLKFISDPVLFGRHIAELNATNNTLVRSYVWGLDLSGTLDGAGGVGGLLWVTQHSGPSAGAHFCAYDGKGDVWQLVSASTGTETARYEYGPFGEPVRTTGPAAYCNPFRISTKRTDPATGLVLYEYRAYSPALGRWLSRDPLGEAKDIALYTCAVNAPLGLYDVLGLASRPCREAIRKDGRPRIVFDPAPPAGGWKGVVRFSGYSGSAQARMFHEIHIEWKASVAVLCVCAGGCEVRRGQRVYRDMGTGDWLVYDPTSLPEQIPNPYQDLWRLLGELLAALFLEVIGPVPLLADEGELASVEATVTAMVARRPTTPWEGEWSDGKSPCHR